MASKTKFKLSDFICSQCGNTTTLQRIIAKQFPLYNETLIWCSRCKKNVKHIEVQNADILNKKFEFIGPETSTEAKVYKLMQKNNRI